MKMDLSIKAIASKLKEISEPNDPFLTQFAKDERKGVLDLLEKWKRNYQKQVKTKEAFEEMSRYENSIKEQGFTMIAGIDEVGRGPLAGPVVACAVILPEEFYLPGLNDSKQVSEVKRDQYYEIIQKEAISIGIGIIYHDEIDKINIYEATKKAMLAAISNLTTVPDHLLIDAMTLDVPMPQLSLIKGDAKSISIAAASIVAKVTRDRMMKEYAITYPNYAFEKNMGYGTAAHLEGLKKFGVTPWHRRSFSPVKEYTLAPLE